MVWFYPSYSWKKATHRPALPGGVVLARRCWRSVALRSVRRLLQHGVEHLADELLLRLGQAMDLLQLLFKLGGGTTLALGFGGLRADERLHRGL